MKKCILCETSKEDNEFNREHVVPKQLGGSFTVFNLCKDCNTKLGDELDKKVAENLLFKIYKNNEKIKSNSGNHINPFEYFVSDEDENRKIEIVTDEEGNLKISSIPQYEPKLEIKNETHEKKATGILTTEDKIPIEDLSEIFNELGEELNVKLSPEGEEEIKSGKVETKRINHVERFSMDITMYTWPIIKLFVRIAYEIAFYKLGDEYFNDPMKSNLKNYLESDDKYIEDLQTRYGISIGFVKNDEINSVISNLAQALYKDENLLHHITIQPARVNGINGIHCVISLFNKLTAYILISENFNRYDIDTLSSVMMFKNNEEKYNKKFKM